MATTVQGFGTSFIGQRDFGPDGSYVTTEWIVLLFVPVIPLRSLKVTETTKNETQAPFRSKQHYIVHRQLPIQLKQVLFVYGFMVLYVGLCVSAAMTSKLLPSHVAEAILDVVVIGAPWLVPWYVRSRAKKRIGMLR